jgi:diguanylate cyclase (GGDEF)-like protein
MSTATRTNQPDSAGPASPPVAPSADDAMGACLLARIVIIDDEPLNAGDLEVFLRSLGYQQVAQVGPGADLLDALRGEHPDLILLDLALRMPSAFDLLEAINGDRLLRHVPVFALAAQDHRAGRLQALGLGAADHLVKPIDGEDLRLRLRNTLATKLHHDRLATTDSLTGLPNRESALQRLDWAMKFALRHNRPGAVLQVGIDRFKHINEALGPALGDELLRVVGQRLLASLRGTDMVMLDSTADQVAQLSRGDGDEFTVLLPALEREDHASVVARRIVESIATPFQLGGHEVFVTCHIGIAVFQGERLDKDEVLRHAKLAMQHARIDGDATSTGIRFYSQELNGRAVNRLTVERELHHALERNELVLHFQPKVDLRTGRIAGAEALVRWQHPRRGLLAPGAFIEVAEDCGLIVPLGNWVLCEALRQLASWRSAGLPSLSMAVNVSSLQLKRPDLERTVAEALASSGVEGSELCLELTESVIMEGGEHVIGRLHAIKALGVRLALDDFGTGYSSLSYLRRLPIDQLKIDRSFIVECHTLDSTATTITRAIIAMARGMALTVVAEGIETREQLAFVRANGCDEFQGYLFSKPVAAEQFEALMRLQAIPPSADPAWASGP